MACELIYLKLVSTDIHLAIKYGALVGKITEFTNKAKTAP